MVENNDEQRYLTPEEEKEIKEVAREFVSNYDVKKAIEYLKTNPQNVTEFCLSVKDLYQPNDATTPLLRIAEILEQSLKNQK